MKRRVTKEHIKKMRSNMKSKKDKQNGKVKIVDNFCVAHLRLIKNPDNGMHEACTSIEKPKKSCVGCTYNRKMNRWE
jgi:hypothetical protein